MEGGGRGNGHPFGFLPLMEIVPTHNVVGLAAKKQNKTDQNKTQEPHKQESCVQKMEQRLLNGRAGPTLRPGGAAASGKRFLASRKSSSSSTLLVLEFVAIVSLLPERGGKDNIFHMANQIHLASLKTTDLE